MVFSDIETIINELCTIEILIIYLAVAGVEKIYLIEIPPPNLNDLIYIELSILTEVNIDLYLDLNVRITQTCKCRRKPNVNMHKS